MRLLTYSIFRNCKFKLIPRHTWSRKMSETVELTQPLFHQENAAGDPNLVDVEPGWAEWEQTELRAAALRGMRVLPAFLSEQEEALMLTELEPVLRRMRYEFDHWDNAIHGYRETERGSWRAENEAVLARVRRVAFPPPPAAPPMPRQHVLDLAPAGHIAPHVDALRFCGDVIAGLCLSSAAVMRLQHSSHKHLQLTALLPRRCLYIMSGAARYEFTHAVPAGELSAWRGARVPKLRRVAVITRSQPPPAPLAPPPPRPDRAGGKRRSIGRARRLDIAECYPARDLRLRTGKG